MSPGSLVGGKEREREGGREDKGPARSSITIMTPPQLTSNLAHTLITSYAWDCSNPETLRLLNKPYIAIAYCYNRI